MKVCRISKCIYIDDFKGSGALSYSGRWHSKGTHILYTAATPSLALLESVVHISNILISGYCMICLEIPTDKIQEIRIDELPYNWYINPPPDVLKSYGNSFIKNRQFLALKLPSAIIPEESNYLLNPNHPDFKFVQIVFKRNIPIDERLLKGKSPFK